jgi:hypothetical protein
MTVNQVRSLFSTSSWNAIDMPTLEALVESSTTLSFHVLAGRPGARVTRATLKLRPHSGTNA